MDFGKMETSWEEGDVISKILNENENGMTFKNEEKTPMKSLYEEFMEIGEKYELIPSKVEAQLNSVDHLKEVEVADEHMKKVKTASLLKTKKKVFNPLQFRPHPPPQLSNIKSTEKTLSTERKTLSTEKRILSTEEKTLSTEGRTASTEVANKNKKVIRPPPGFPAKPSGKKPQSNLLKELLDPKRIPQSTSKKSKPTPKHIPNVKTNIPKSKPSNVTGMMKEFESLSVVMDQEIYKYEDQLLTDRTKDEGRVDIMKTLYYEQQERTEKMNLNHQENIKIMEKEHQEKLRKFELEHQQEVQKLKKTFEKEKEDDEEIQQEFYKLLDERQLEVDGLNALIGDLQSQLEKRPSALSPVGGDLKKLKNEFDNELYESEEEIDRLNATIFDLKYRLETYEEGGHDHIAWENEELVEKVVIKDEYISTLKLKIENLEKLHQQEEWKLSQADDNLEMVERKASDMERKAVEIMTKMKNELLKERQLNQQLHQHINMMDKNLTQIAQHNNAVQMNNELNQANREKLARMAKRSLSRRGSSIDLSKDAVMKSLGWCIAPSK